jgi:hypothetical protein
MLPVISQPKKKIKINQKYVRVRVDKRFNVLVSVCVFDVVRLNGIRNTMKSFENQYFGPSHFDPTIFDLKTGLYPLLGEVLNDTSDFSAVARVRRCVLCSTF